MKVKELIQELSQQPPDQEVICLETNSPPHQSEFFKATQVSDNRAGKTIIYHNGVHPYPKD